MKSHRVRAACQAVALAATCSVIVPGASTAQVRSSGYAVPSALAAEAALEAVKACADKGYAVSAAVVDTGGTLLVFVKGDHSTDHTRWSSFRKAYTVTTLGPVFGFDDLGPFVEQTRGAAGAAALATLPDILLLAGAVAIRAKGEVVAAIGVGGAPGGEKDEACALRGLDRIRDRLPH